MRSNRVIKTFSILGLWGGSTINCCITGIKLRTMLSSVTQLITYLAFWWIHGLTIELIGLFIITWVSIIMIWGKMTIIFKVASFVWLVKASVNITPIWRVGGQSAIGEIGCSDELLRGGIKTTHITFMTHKQIMKLFKRQWTFPYLNWRCNFSKIWSQTI